jgi:hypothetical protein
LTRSHQVVPTLKLLNDLIKSLYGHCSFDHHQNIFENGRYKKTDLVVTKFVQSCVELNASVFEPFIEEDAFFEDKYKNRFLADLKDLFQLSKNKARFETIVKQTTGNCLGCVYGHEIKRFDVYEGNELRFDFGFLISVQNGILVDIYRCNFYKEMKCRWVKPEGMPALFIEYTSNRLKI